MKKFLVGGMKIRVVCEVLKKPEMQEALITPLDGETLESETLGQILENAHYKRTREHFWCAVGQKDRRESAKFKKAIPITEGHPFYPNEIGRRIWGERIYHMGWKPIH